jgi:rod shape-determining protein MreD
MQVLPALSVLSMAVLAVLPWGGDDAVRFAIALMPMMSIQYWAARRPGILPTTLVFAAGLFVDVMSSGPLGFWSLLALLALALGRLEGLVTERSTPAGRAAACLCALVVLAAATWAVASVYFNHVVDWRALARGALYVAAAYPLLALVLLPIDRLLAAPRTRLFSHGG